jgi:hypothetical protein
MPIYEQVTKYQEKLTPETPSAPTNRKNCKDQNAAYGCAAA